VSDILERGPRTWQSPKMPRLPALGAAGSRGGFHSNVSFSTLGTKA
jgi:hypothetical protein